MRVKIHLNTLLLKNNFAISHGAYSYRERLVIEIDALGVSGFGETVAIDYYGISISALNKAAKKIIPAIEKFSHTHSHKSFYDILLELLPHNPFLRCAFDCAYIDLQAQLQQLSIRAYLGIKGDEKTASSITLGLSDTPALIEERLSEDWPIYKVKINEDDRSHLYKLINERDKKFGVDANGALGLGQAQKVVRQLQEHGALYGEQLVHKMNIEEAGKLDFGGEMVQLADEAITSLASAQKISPFYDGLVLKLTKCGGITPVLDIIQYAKSEDKKLLAGCMTESSIGINNMLALLPLFDYADLDGAFLISNDEEVCSIDKRPKRILQTNGYFTEI